LNKKRNIHSCLEYNTRPQDILLKVQLYTFLQVFDKSIYRPLVQYVNKFLLLFHERLDGNAVRRNM